MELISIGFVSGSLTIYSCVLNEAQVLQAATKLSKT